MREGSLDAPLRRPIDWREEAYYDAEDIDAELRRVFDICHGCRRCFNLCDSFPRLFDLIDDSPTGELDSVESAAFQPVLDACTLCDMCFMTKCPYVPPHEFDLDFPHLMLRARAAEFKRGERRLRDRALAETDRNARLARPLAGLVNWASKTSNGMTRPLMQAALGIDKRAAVPPFAKTSFEGWSADNPLGVNRQAPAYGRKAVLYATCYVNFNEPGIGKATREVLAHNGVQVEIVYPECCGMPKLENGDIEAVAEGAERVSEALIPWIEKGYEVIALVPSCALMLKFEWPLILPENGAIRRLSENTSDVAEYVVDIAKNEGLVDGLEPLEGGIALHLACHARAQNMGAKAAEMLRLLPDTQIQVVERCSGHGGKWGMMKENYETAIKVGRTAARQSLKGAAHVVSECPLAGLHLAQGMDQLDSKAQHPPARHPIELMARSYELDKGVRKGDEGIANV